METVANIEAIIQGLIATGFLFVIILGIFFEMVMFFLLPFFVYRIRKEVIQIRETLASNDTIELTDIVKS